MGSYPARHTSLTTRLSSSASRLAVVYNDYMSVMGGGERSSLAYARALYELGYDVELLSVNEVPSRERIIQAFGEEFADIKLKRASLDDVLYYQRVRPHVFVNHTFMSFLKNIGRVSIYLQMFPYLPVNKVRDPRRVALLDTYQLMLCNSSYTLKHTMARWEYDPGRMRVLHPPISTTFIEISKELERSLPEKKKQFVCLGRFDPLLHSKNQHIIIEAFSEASREFPILEDWKLILIGHVAPDERSQNYFATCLRLAEQAKGRIILENGLPLPELSAILRESFGYVHATGAFVRADDEPEKCEHLGLSIVEAMAHGCIPLVYGAGGIFDVLAPHRGGIFYYSREELKRGFVKMATLFNTDEAARRQLMNLHDARQLSFDNFRQRLGSILAEVTDDAPEPSVRLGV